MSVTALCALAIKASGDVRNGETRDALGKATSWIVKNVDGEWRVWDFACAGIFLSETARTDPSDDVKSAMRSIARTLIVSRRHGGPEPGRTAMALYNLRRSGESDSDVYARGLPYVRRLRDEGKLIGMGGQMDYLQGALFSHALGDEDWEAYRSRYFPRILRALAEERFWRLPSDNEKDHDPNVPSWTEFWTNQDWWLVGPYYTIALFTLSLEVPDARLNLLRRE